MSSSRGVIGATQKINTIKRIRKCEGLGTKKYGVGNEWRQNEKRNMIKSIWKCGCLGSKNYGVAEKKGGRGHEGAARWITFGNERIWDGKEMGGTQGDGKLGGEGRKKEEEKEDGESKTRRKLAYRNYKTQNVNGKLILP